MPKASKASIEQTLAAAGREYLDLQIAEAKIADRKAELQTLFREHLDLGPHLAGDAKVSIQRNVRRDDKAFEAAYPFEQYPDYYKASIDTATIKRELAPAVLDRFQILGDNKVVVTAIEQGA